MTADTRKRLALLCPPGWTSFLTDIEKHLHSRYDLRTCYTESGAEITEAVKWADIVWLEWANELAVEVTNKLPMIENKRVICRLHSYEAFDGFIPKVNWDRVDDLIFVAEHIKRHALILRPALKEQVKRIHVIPNGLSPERFELKKRAPGKNLAFVGNVNYKKGPMLLLHAFRELLKHDSGYRLFVAGRFQDKRYALYFDQMIRELALEKNIVLDGWVDDISGWLDDKQYIVSSSLLESQGVGIMEGMLHGLKPVIHNFAGASEIYDRRYLWNSIGEFVQMILSDEYDSAEYRTCIEERYSLKAQLKALDKMFAANPGNHQPEKAAMLSPSENKPTHGIDFNQPLPRTAELVDNRKQFLIEFCRGKRVLHIGCVDSGLMEQRIAENNFLHYHISRVADELIGADIDDDGLRHLANAGYEVHRLDLQADCELLQKLAARVDLIIIPEVIEHLSNVGQALDNLKQCRFKGDMVVTTPNAFSYRAAVQLARGVELVHPDHNCYFSPTTLKTLLAKHGFDIARLLLYWWPTDDETGRNMARVLPNCPYYAEGLIAIIRDCDQ